MKIVVSGSTGLIGTALKDALRRRGADVLPLVRRPVAPGEHALAWDPERGTIDSSGLERFGAEAVVHLAGETVVGRWTAAKKQRVRDSRVVGTRTVSDAIAGLQHPPATLLAASAVGYYGDRGDEILGETSAPGDDFLARVARDWEAATAAAARARIRVINMRNGIVLATQGGALAKMLPPFRLGLGGTVASGNQYFSWIALDDIINAILYLLDTPNLAGPVNMTAPHPVTNREFTKTLGRVLGRPTVVPVPQFALRMAFGAEGAAILLAGQRVVPNRLHESGFRFAFETVEPALRHLLARAESAR